MPPEPDSIGAFGKGENCLEEWTFFGGETGCDPRGQTVQTHSREPSSVFGRSARHRPKPVGERCGPGPAGRTLDPRLVADLGKGSDTAADRSMPTSMTWDHAQ